MNASVNHKVLHEETATSVGARAAPGVPRRPAPTGQQQATPDSEDWRMAQCVGARVSCARRRVISLCRSQPRAGLSKWAPRSIASFALVAFWQMGCGSALELSPADGGVAAALNLQKNTELARSNPPVSPTDDPSGDPPEESMHGTLEVAPVELDFGRAGLEGAIEVANVGWGPLQFTIPEVEGLDVFPSSGAVSPGEPVTVSVAASRCGLTPGVQELVVVVNADNGDQETVTVTIEIRERLQDYEIVELLQDLPSLPKRHYSWWVVPEQLGAPANDSVGYHWVRITHCVTIRPGWIDYDDVLDAVKLCKAVNEGSPTMPATIALVYSPYHDLGLDDRPPDCPEWVWVVAEEDCQAAMDEVQGWLSDANAHCGTDVQVSAILLDTEMPLWWTREQGEPDAQAWNEALDDRYNAIYNICKDVFNDYDVPVHWFLRGQPCCHRRFTTEELGDSYGAVCYQPDDPPAMRRTFMDYYDQALADGVTDLLVWISLGSGYEWMPSGRSIYICDLQYSPKLSWRLGAELNDPAYSPYPGEDAPWDAAQAVVLYPGPSGSYTPQFFEHFKAYVLGANGLNPPPQPTDPAFPKPPGPDR